MLTAPMKELYEAAKQCISDDCDAVIHPLCWDRLKKAVKEIDSDSPERPE